MMRAARLALALLPFASPLRAQRSDSRVVDETAGSRRTEAAAAPFSRFDWSC